MPTYLPTNCFVILIIFSCNAERTARSSISVQTTFQLSSTTWSRTRPQPVIGPWRCSTLSVSSFSSPALWSPGWLRALPLVVPALSRLQHCSVYFLVSQDTPTAAPAVEKEQGGSLLAVCMSLDAHSPASEAFVYGCPLHPEEGWPDSANRGLPDEEVKDSSVQYQVSIRSFFILRQKNVILYYHFNIYSKWINRNK